MSNNLLNIKWNKYIPHKPTPKQLAFLSLPHEEAFYGGAAGGGKSDALLMGALQHCDAPAYSAILFRRTLTDHKLPDSILNRAHQWLAPFVATKEVRFVSSEHTFYFPSGARLAFGYLATELGVHRYQSAQFQYVGFDELTQFIESDYVYLFSRLRRLVSQDIPIRMRSASNPGNRGAVWVKRRFKIEQDGDTGHFIGRNKKAPFIPSRVADNPFIDQSYLETLDKLDKVTRERLKYGDWSISDDSRMDSQWFKNRWHKKGDYYVLNDGIESKSYRLGQLLIFGCVDIAASVRTGISGATFYSNKMPSYSVIAIFAMTPDFHLIWLYNLRLQVDIPRLQNKIERVVREWKPLFVRIEANGMGQGVYQTCEKAGIPVKPIQTSHDKIVNSTAAQIRAERGKVWLPTYAPWMKELEEELFTWTGHPDETDDQIDVFSSSGNEVASRSYGVEMDSYFRKGSSQAGSIPVAVGGRK